MKIIKIDEDLEEEVMEQHVLMENTYVDPITTMVANQALFESMKENVVAKEHTVQS